VTFLRSLFNPLASARVLAGAILLGYCFLPLWFYYSTGIDDAFDQLAAIAGVASVVILVGFHLTLRGGSPGRRISFSLETLVLTVWLPFIASSLVIIATAPAIPLISALKGASPDLLALQREEFLKARGGIASILVYINALFTGALVPYTIALMFVHNMRRRWPAAMFFLLYAISFLEKAFFFKLAIPLVYLLVTGVVRSRLGPKSALAAALGVLLFLSAAAGVGSDTSESEGDFFSTNYAPHGVVGHLVWRSVAIPMITAADAIRVFQDFFGGHAFHGATSSLFARTLGLPRIEFERILFEQQYGQNETGTGSANSVFVTEAFINFGWLGVVLFGLVAGITLRSFANSRDEAFRSIWPLYCMGLYTSGLIGLLFSNGFILVFVITRLLEFSPHQKVTPTDVPA
jgi:hypothetical protein